jgi:TP901 family phage tail tape measure protein
MQATGKKLTFELTAPIAALGAIAVSTFAEFEHQMSKVKAVSGATGDQFKALEADAKRLGGSTVFTATEVGALQEEFAKLGFTADEITKVTEATLYLAQATGSDLAASAEVAGATLRGFGLDAIETSRVTDVMAMSFNKSALDLSSFADSMKYVAPVAKVAGVSLEETTAMLAVLADRGIKGSQAGTSLRRILTDLGSERRRKNSQS